MRSATLTLRAAAAAAATAAGGCCFAPSTRQQAIQTLARTFARDVMKPQARHYDETMEYPADVFEQAWKLGLVNPHIPAKYGGGRYLPTECQLGGDGDRSLLGGVLEECLIGEEFGWGCTGIGTALQINSIAEAPLLVAGTEAQKKKYLGRMTEEPLKAAYCVTEPGGGSDVAGMKTRAVRSRKSTTTTTSGGAGGDEWVLNGEKMWITNGGVANWYFVLAKTPSEKQGSSSDVFTGFIVDANSPGVSHGKKEINMGQRCSDTRSVTFTDVVVPAENVVGGVGDGFKVSMKTFDLSRPMVAILAVGLARRALEDATEYAQTTKTRKSGKMICEHQAVQFMLADMAAGIEANRLLAHKGAYEVDCGRRNTFIASCAKLLASEHLQKCVSDAVQIFGANGCSTKYEVEKLYRDARIYTIYEGTSQIQRLIISRHLFEEAAKKKA